MDDDENFLRSLQDGLERYKDEFIVYTACSGKEAMEILIDNRVDVIISDLKMQEMDGFQLLSFVIENFPYIPFILMTAYGSPVIRDKSEKWGAIRYLEKPLTLQRIVEAIKEVLQEELHQRSRLNYPAALYFAQLIKLHRKSCYLFVSSGEGKKGVLIFKNGELKFAKTEKEEGEKAAIEILSWHKVKITVRDVPEIDKDLLNVKTPLDELIMSALNKIRKKEGSMSVNYEEIIEALKGVPGYKGAAIFNVNGEELAFHAMKQPEKLRKFFLQMTSLFVAGDKAAEKSDAGGLDFIQTDSDFGKFLARQGEKHIVMVLLEEDGNLALAKDALEDASSKI